MTRPDNQLNRVLTRIDRLPAGLRLRAFDFTFGRMIRAYRSLRIRTTRLEPTCVEMQMRNRRRTRNHLGGIHGVIAQVPGEFASGILIAHWVPKGAIVVVKSMQATLTKPVRGDIRAVATLPEARLRAAMDQPSGDVTVPVQVIDETGDCPMQCQVTMAWFLKEDREQAA